MLNQFSINRFSEFGALTDEEVAAIRGVADPPKAHGKSALLREQGAQTEGFYYLISGMISVSMLLPSGKRQIVKVHFPGDVVGSPSMALVEALETLTALTPVTVSHVPYAKFARLLERHPRIAAYFLMSVQYERVILCDRLISNGRSSALSRVAALILDFEERLNPPGLSEKRSFHLPLTQEQMGDMVSLTAIHVNRSLRELDERGLIKRSKGHYTVIRRVKLDELSARGSRRLRRDAPWLPEARAAS